MKNYLSIDIGGTNVKYAELDNAGQIIKKDKIKTIHDKKQFLAEIDKIVAEYVDKGVKGIAFCAPGKIAKTTIHFGGALPFLDGIDFAQRYKKYNVSKEYLSRFFKKQMEITVDTYINNVRAQHAYFELKNTSHNLTQVAMNNGFSGVRTMNRAFDKLYGKTASQIKRSFKK